MTISELYKHLDPNERLRIVKRVVVCGIDAETEDRLYADCYARELSMQYAQENIHRISCIDGVLTIKLATGVEARNI